VRIESIHELENEFDTRHASEGRARAPKSSEPERYSSVSVGVSAAATSAGSASGFASAFARLASK
jgi:hypothetical protein